MECKPGTFARKSTRLIALLAALGLAIAACGSDDDEATDDTAETTAPETSETSETSDTTAPETSETSEAPADGVPIELVEWSISDPGQLSAGSITFAIDNIGENSHALAIARGVAYEDLPLKDNGAVDTEALGDDYLGASENVPAGETSSLDVELTAGDYVLFCPIEFGPNSHAANGQVQSVTVG
jgi:ABC-type glycerol-3-phosphate transport system substrate-binding protein